MRNRKWLQLLAYVTGSVNQELLLQNEYLAAENRILRMKLPNRLRLSDPERITLAEIGKRVGRKALREIASVAKPDTILAWYRKLIAQKFDGSKNRAYPGRPRIAKELEALIVQMARENSGWGYDSIVGALANLGYTVSDQTVGNVLRRHGIAPAPKRGRTMSWKDFLAAHMNVSAGADFFTVEVLRWRGLVTYYVLFFIHLETRRVTIAGITRHPDGAWMEQIARSATQETWGYLNRCRYVLHDRDKKFFLPGGVEGRRRETDHASGQESELERLCRTLGSIGETRVLVQTDSLRGRPVAAEPLPVHGALSFRTQPPGQGQSATDAADCA